MTHSEQNRELFTIQVTEKEKQFIESLRSLPPDLAFIRSDKGYLKAYLLGLLDKLDREMGEEIKAA